MKFQARPQKVVSRTAFRSVAPGCRPSDPVQVSDRHALRRCLERRAGDNGRIGHRRCDWGTRRGGPGDAYERLDVRRSGYWLEGSRLIWSSGHCYADGITSDGGAPSSSKPRFAASSIKQKQHLKPGWIQGSRRPLLVVLLAHTKGLGATGAPPSPPTIYSLSMLGPAQAAHLHMYNVFGILHGGLFCYCTMCQERMPAQEGHSRVTLFGKSVDLACREVQWKIVEIEMKQAKDRMRVSMGYFPLQRENCMVVQISTSLYL